MSVLALAVVAACKPAPTPDDYFGTTVVPPRGLDKIKPGMTQKEALAAQPAARLVRRSSR
jgi:outer membrane protein assembly factor BamE (lipoprotein component of BamABCDE complex)